MKTTRARATTVARLRRLVGVGGWLAFVAAIAAWMTPGKHGHGVELLDSRRPAVTSRSVASEPLPDPAETGLPAPGGTDLASTSSFLAFAASPQGQTGGLAKRLPVRVIRDPYAAFSAVAVDVSRDEVVFTDENLFQILVFNRLENVSPQARMSEPKRILAGLKTKIEFQCGLYVDQKNGDIYAVNNDTVDTLVIFSRKAQGDVPPDRELHTPHGTFGIAVDEERQELFLTVQHDHAVVVYPKMARGEDSALRLLQGDRTRLADPHGIALDPKNKLIFVTNYGSVVQFRRGSVSGSGGRSRTDWPLSRRDVVPGSGRILPPAITVYSRDASGDAPPLRVVEGPRTQLNWPTGIAVDPERGELFVANDAADSILVFEENAHGDAAPIRVLRGPRTQLKNPTGVFLDTKNDELWVANFGNHTATVYGLTAQGDTAPLRTIRSAPSGEPTPIIGNPHPLAYDTRREEILVPN